jgi:TonB family protein
MKEVKLNHEFLADRAGKEDPEYWKELLNETIGTRFFTPVNAFYSPSTIKTRITMISKQSAKSISKWRYALFIPVLALSLWVVSCEKPMTREVLSEVEVMPEFPGGKEALWQFFGENFVYPDELKEEGIEGKVILSFVVESDGSVSNVKAVKSDHPKLEQPAADFVSQMPDWKPGMQDGKAVAVELKLPVMYTMDKEE